jgi:DNA-binding GntR family transcriptional regulator
MTIRKTTGKKAAPELDDAQPRVVSAYQIMRHRILNNEWTAGQQSTEQEIAELLGMSRTPVREAMMRLQQEGLVQVIPRHGMRVLPVSAADMQEIYQILTSLEATAAELAALRRPGPKELEPLEQATAAMTKALKQDDLVAWAKADERFHAQLLELSGNRMLTAVVLNFWDRAHRVRMITLRMRPKPVDSTKDHADLVKAIRKGDHVEARRIHQQHRERAGRELLQLLSKHGLKQL